MTVAWGPAPRWPRPVVIRTNIGDLILDNERDEIVLWKDAGYQFVKWESQDPIGWVAIEGSLAATASIK